VLDPAPARRLDVERLELLERGDPASIVAAIVREPVQRAELLAHGLLSPAELDEGLRASERAGDWHFSRTWLEELRAAVLDRLAKRAASSPLDPGLPLAELLPARSWAGAILPLLGIERRGAKAYFPGAAASLGDREEAAERLERELGEAGANAVKLEDRVLAAYLEEQGRLVRVGDGLAVGTAAYEQAKRALVAECEAGGKITLARFRDLLGSSRKSAQLLLERFDADGVTRRVGDERVLRRRAATRD
jgi:selenocysteine-specific elongation factor